MKKTIPLVTALLTIGAMISGQAAFAETPANPDSAKKSITENIFNSTETSTPINPKLINNKTKETTNKDLKQLFEDLKFQSKNQENKLYSNQNLTSNRVFPHLLGIEILFDKDTTADIAGAIDDYANTGIATACAGISVGDPVVAGLCTLAAKFAARSVTEGFRKAKQHENPALLYMPYMGGVYQWSVTEAPES